MKFLAIVKTLDKKQWSEFLTYLTLYHKSESEICKLASWFDSKLASKSNRELDYKTHEILDELPFKIKRQSLSNALTLLGNLAEEYLGWMVWRQSPNLKTTCQLTALAQKSLSNEYLKTQKEILEDSGNKIISIWNDYYKMRALFNDYYYSISISDDNHYEEFKRLISSFRKSTATIAQFFMVEIRNREKLLSERWEEHKDFFDLLYNNETELVHITDQLILMNHKGETNAYTYLLDILKSKKNNKYSSYVQYCILTYCINFLTGVIKQGSVHRGQELLDLYEYGLEKGIYTLNDSMPLKKFINIIGLASKLEKYTWARKIVDNWAHKVDKYNIKSVAKFGHATIDLHEKNYSSVIHTLSQMKSSNFQHRLRSRWLLLRAQYELNKDYTAVIKVQLDNFRRFLISNESRINRPTFEGIKSSIKILNMILDRRKGIQIENQYNKSKYIFERKWILEKIKNPMR